MPESVAVLGASGFIGSYLSTHLRDIGLDVVGTYCSNNQDDSIFLDLHDVEAIETFLSQFTPTYLLFLSGCKDVGRCEKAPNDALTKNINFVQHYINACNSTKIFPRTIYFSSDYVFDGSKGYYRHDDRIGPRTVYGLTKAMAERLIAYSLGDNSLILRTSAVMGVNGGFHSWLLSELKAGKSVDLFSNTYFSPTSIGNLCHWLEQAICSPWEGNGRTVHFNDGYRLTRLEYGRLLARGMNIPLENLNGSEVDLSNTTLQRDLSMLPDGISEFRDTRLWNEWEAIH